MLGCIKKSVASRLRERISISCECSASTGHTSGTSPPVTSPPVKVLRLKRYESGRELLKWPEKHDAQGEAHEKRIV